MAGGGPAAGGAMAVKFLRQSLGRTVFGLNLSIPFQKPLDVQYKLALGLSEEAQCSLGARSEQHKPSPAQPFLWQASFFFSLAC